MTEAERAFAVLRLRARVVLAILFLIFAGVTRELEAVGSEIPVRIRAAARRSRRSGSRAGALEAHIAERAEMQVVTWLARTARDIAHHEHWDGTGYPDKLEGAEIPLGVRILAVADAFVAMTSERPYRAAPRASEATAALLNGRGTAFDPEVVDRFIALKAAGPVGMAIDEGRAS